MALMSRAKNKNRTAAAVPGATAPPFNFGFNWPPASDQALHTNPQGPGMHQTLRVWHISAARRLTPPRVAALGQAPAPRTPSEVHAHPRAPTKAASSYIASASSISAQMRGVGRGLVSSCRRCARR